MQVTVDDAGPLRKTVTINYSKEEIAAREADKIAQYSSQINLKGFRKGKTPKGLVKKRYGRAIQNEIADELIQNGLRQAMQDNELEPIGPFDDEDRKLEDGLTYVTTFSIKPAVALPEPSSLSLSSEDCSVSDEEVDEELAGFAKRGGDHKELEAGEKLAKDDSITLSGKITSGEGEEVIREIHDLNHLVGAYPLFGKDAAEVEELIAQVGVGEVLEFDTELPERFKPEEWAGKEAHIAVTVQSATRMEAAEIDDEFAKRMGVADVAELKDRVRQSIEQRKQQEQRQQQVEEMTDLLIEQTDFELPEHLFKSMLEENLEGAERTEKEKEEPDAVDKEEIEKNTERFLRRHLIIDAIIREHNIQAERADLDQQLMMAAFQSGRKVEEIEKEITQSGQINQILHEIVEAKAIEFMLSAILGDEAQADGHVHGPDCDHDHEHEDTVDSEEIEEAAAATDDQKSE